MGLLRFLLALAVVITHSDSIFGFRLVGGLVAVKAFYIISGFYMTLILNEKYIGVNNSYKLFISNRFLRLFPIYWTVLILTISFSILMYSKGQYSGSFNNYITYFNSMSISSFVFLLFTNIFLFFQDIVMFLGLDTSSGHLFFTSNFNQTNPKLYDFLFIPQAWTIGVEISFYLIAPFIVRRKLIIIFPLILLSLLLRYILSKYGLEYDPWSYRFFPSELVFFLLGIVSYRMYVYLKRVNIKTLYLKFCLAFILAFTISYSFIPYESKIYAYFLSFFICLPFVFILTKKWKYDTYIGELSYPIYISHLFVLTCIWVLKIPVVGGIGLSLSIITILFSILINELVAKRIEKIRQKRIMTTANFSGEYKQ
jgi:peptidoglycan/LPS O-acetylase OafA/YrhL